MAQLGSIEFFGVRGVIIPAASPTVIDLDNPAQIDATLSIQMAQRSTLTFEGWFADSQRDALYALVDTVVDATDETLTAARPVKVVKITSLTMQPAQDHDTTDEGFFTTVVLDVRDWPS